MRTRHETSVGGSGRGAEGAGDPAAGGPALAAQDRFVRRWGQMGPAWGVSRTAAEVYALLYVGGQPCCTDDVMRRLCLSRGGASTTLRALCDAGAVRRLNRSGDRRDYYVASHGVWHLAGTRAIGRQRLGLRPVLDAVRQGLATLGETVADPAVDDRAVAFCRARLARAGESLETLDRLLGEVATQFVLAAVDAGR